jgi:hypothetical protein
MKLRTQQIVKFLYLLNLDLGGRPRWIPEIQDRFPALPDFLRSSDLGTGSTQPRKYINENITYWVMHPVACVSIKYWNNLRTQQSIFWC